MIKKFSINNKDFLITKNGSQLTIKKHYHLKTIKYLKKEIAGYKKFKKLNYFKIPHLYSYKKIGKNNYIKIEYIDGNKVSIFELGKIYNKNKIIHKKINIKRYLARVKNENKNNPLLNKLFNEIIFLFKNQKNIFISDSHGDFVHYNCIKKKNRFYVFDFEKYEIRTVLFDFLNWYINPFISKFSKITIFFNLNYRSDYILNIFKIFSEIIILKVIFKSRWLKSKIDKKNYQIYVLLYLLEKILIIKNDINFIKNNKNKKIAKLTLYFLNIIFKIFSKKMRR